MAHHVVNWYRPVLTICNQFRPRYCLDVGCGHGHITEYLQTRGIICIGLDVKIETLQANIKSLFVNADAQNLPFRNGIFDMILAFELLEHLPAPEKALAEFHRALKSRGIFILTTPTPKSPVAKLQGHISVKSKRYWISRLKLLGFNVRIIPYMYEVEETNLPIPIKGSPKLLKRLIQNILCFYKRYVSITSTKLLCIKESC